MKTGKSNQRILALFLAFIFILSFARPAVVFAEDGQLTEPAPAVEETQTPPGEETVVPTEEPVPTVEEETPPIVEEIIEQIPQDTSIIVVNTEGQVVPLASEEAAEIIMENDPMWCNSDWTTCYNDATLEGLIVQLTTAGIIGSGVETISDGYMYFTSTYNGTLLFDNSITGNMHGMGNISVYGGWDGEADKGNWTSNTPKVDGDLGTTISSPLTFQNWFGNIWINYFNGDVVVDNVTLPGNSGGNDYGIGIGEIDGNVTIKNIDAIDPDLVDEAYYWGLDVSYVTGDVTITDSHFDNFYRDDGWEGNGAAIESVDGTVTVTNSSFSNNNGVGLQLENTTGDLIISNTQMNNNGYEGLWMIGYGAGDVILSAVTADNNKSAGFLLYDVDDVTITNSSFSGNNYEDGDASNTIFGASNISITNSHFDDNDEGSSGLIIDWGDWLYDSNDGSWLDDWSLEPFIGDPGNVTITSSTFSNNNSYGLIYDGWMYDEEYEGEEEGGEYTYNKDAVISITNSEFDDNYRYGLRLNAAGTANLNLLTADANGRTNIAIFDVDNVNITNSTSTNAEQDGINIEDADSILLSGVTVNGNGWVDGGYSGVCLNEVGGVTITNSSFNNNDYAGILGTDLWGDVTISNVNTNFNGVYAGEDDFEDSYGRGIKLSGFFENLELGEEFGFDDFLPDLSEGLGSNLIIQNTNANNNTRAGLDTYNLLNQTITGSHFNENLTGANLSSSKGDLTITQSTFNENGMMGFYIDAVDGDITISKVAANENGVLFSELLNAGEPEPDNLMGFKSSGGQLDGNEGTLTVSYSTFSENAGNGLNVLDQSGSITLTNVTATGNGQIGLVLESNNGVTTVICSTANSNGVGGLDITSWNDATLDGVTAEGNGTFSFIAESATGEVIELIGCKGVEKKEKEEIVPEGKIVPVNGGENVPLDCSYLWTMLVLPEESQAKFAGFCNMNAVFNHVSAGSLPGEVPDGYAFVGGYANSVEGSSGVMPNSGYARLSLVVPETEDGNELVVLYWDAGAGKWVEVPMVGNEASFSASDPAMKVLSGVQVSGDGKVIFSVNFTGTFVVVSK